MKAKLTGYHAVDVVAVVKITRLVHLFQSFGDAVALKDRELLVGVMVVSR